MILDTCALLWLAGGGENRLSDTALKKIDEALDVYVSAITGFEIGIKHRVGKLQLPVPPEEWFDEVLNFHRIEKLDLDLELCIRASQLPMFHKDPCDRFIIATALTLQMPVVTLDRRIGEYGVKLIC
jgi:PIN domain nuclease of toxin-antitoxin system